MATSTIVLYTTNITPEKNCKVDDIVTYLESCNKMTIGSFQYSKILLDDTIKINWNQNELPNFPFNYLSIKKSDDINDKTYYYFILNSNWKSQNTVELQISLDTVNTFWNDLNFTSRTNITRQHKDRFSKKTTIPTSGNVKLFRQIDKYEEGFTPTKTTQVVEKLNYSAPFNLDYYLIYRTNPDAEQTLECLCCASDRLQLGANAPTTNGIQYTDIPVGQSIIILGEENSSFTIEGQLIGAKSGYPGVYIQRNASNMSLYAILKEGVTGAIIRENITNTTVASYVKYNLMSKQYAKNFLYLADAKYAVKHDTVASYTINSTYVSDISTIDRTDTKLVKIIKMPYAPFELTKNAGGQLIAIDGFYEQDHLLHLYNLDQEFISTVGEDTLNELTVSIPVEQLKLSNPQNANPRYESKIYNSNYYGIKYFYDSFEKEFLLERYSSVVDGTETPFAGIKFKQSNNISSSSLFDFQFYNGQYDEPTPYSRYLNSNRQNEIALYTNDYLNYIRTGFNYDKKIKNTNNVANWIGAGVSIAGAVASFASSIYTSGAGIAAGVALTTSAVATLTSAITNTVSSEQSLDQKLRQLRQQSSSVSNTEDLNLLSYYNGNRLLITREAATDEVLTALYNLFNRTGYACNDYSIPQFNSRRYYNFLQAKIDIDESLWKYGKSFLDDIRARFEIGVTVYHRVNDSYDWSQEKENFESWLVING